MDADSITFDPAWVEQISEADKAFLCMYGPHNVTTQLDQDKAFLSSSFNLDELKEAVFGGVK
jgi:hypothetical protein